MNNRNSKIGILIIALVVIGVASCDDADTLVDLTAPVIEVRDPEYGKLLPAGDFILFEAGFIDDVELATYNIEIHDNFSGHGHGRIAKANDDPTLLKWAFKESFLIPEGLRLFEAILEDDILIPGNAMAGPYHFIIQAIDKAGNSTSFQDNSAVELEIMITNESQPVVRITNLVNGELEIEKDKLFMVEGDISDPTVGEYAGISSLDVVLAEEDEHGVDHDHGGRVASESLMDVLFEEADLENFMIDEKIILEDVFSEIDFKLADPEFQELMDEEVDHLVLKMTVKDEQGNITVSRTDVHIHIE
jgi:hypothetical protein